ncbi:MAG: S8 family serine peptidase [candidate division Zixibacteria bacterium]|nr:S8 family serine peptidase [candidate division Zixibacteria bacterium]
MTSKIGNFAAIGCYFLILTISTSSASGQMLSPSLEGLIADYQEDGRDSLVEVVVFLDNGPGKDAVTRTSQASQTRAERIKQVTRYLRSYEAPRAAEIKKYLEEHSSVAVVQRWIVPAYVATISVSRIEVLSDLVGVKRVVENVRLTYPEPVKTDPAPFATAVAVSEQLQLLNVPALWDRGLYGQGRLVCSFDTGVEGTHPALSGKWRGNHASLSATWFSTVSPNDGPIDNVGHGTHTMGVMVGAVEADTFGVAPQAEWIAAGVIDQGKTLPATLNDILEAFEWTLNPDGNESTTDDVPDVILNSWGVPKGLFTPCDNLFTAAIANVEAAGIVTVFSAGNEGPAEMTLRYPADMATTPTNTFSVGAVDNNRLIASFSSRGPSSCDHSQKKPEIVAPGVSIRSSYKDGTYKYMSGTSMAAPYIGGLVALMRQYSPESTVEQIKYAFIQAATDLGVTGEDNAYGYGLPDAARLLAYLPVPLAPEMNLSAAQILGDGVAFPSETFELEIGLTNSGGSVEEIVGTLRFVGDSGVQILNGVANFVFGEGGIHAVSEMPCLVRFEPYLRNGLLVPFKLDISLPGDTVFQTFEFSLTVGIPPAGNIAAHENGEISLCVSDFGQFGFAPGSIYNLSSQGLRYQGSNNLLYEAGMIVGRNSLQISSSVRDSLGQYAPSDFTPVEALSAGLADAEGGFRLESSSADTYSDIPIPISVGHETISYNSSGETGYILFKFQLRNESVETLTGLCFGFMVDLDLSSDGDRVTLDRDRGIVYQSGDGSPLVGLVALDGITNFTSLENGLNKAGFTRVQLYKMVSATGSDVDSTRLGDMLFLAHGGAFTLRPRESADIAFALVCGNDLSTLFANADRARDKYDVATDVTFVDPSVPDKFELLQNYPNPFNPATTITFSLPRAAETDLTVINILGREVKTLHSGILSAGTHSVVWDGTASDGRTAANGVYFYRLESGGNVSSKKMTLLK